MHTKHSSIHHRPQTQIIENITTISPNVTAPILPLAFIVESVNLSDLSGFMISTDEGDTIRIPDFKEEEEKECLDGIETSIDKVACDTRNISWVWAR
jgi:hypothetical protein